MRDKFSQLNIRNIQVLPVTSLKHRNNPQLARPVAGLSFLLLPLLYLAKGGHFRHTLYNNTAYFEYSNTSEQLFDMARRVLLLVVPFNDHFKILERFLTQVQS